MCGVVGAVETELLHSLMKKTFLLCLALVSSIGLMVGCNTTKPGGLFSEVDAKPPTAMELKLFKALTNYEDRVTVHTNVVSETNAAGVVTSHGVVTQETNRVAVTQLAPGAGSNTITGIITGIAGLFGWGGVAGLGSGALVQEYLKRRNRALAGAQIDTLQDVRDTLVQNVEVLRNVIASTPQGNQLSVAVKNYLMQHQVESGVIQHVAEIVDQAVDADDAQQKANEIQALLKDFTKAGPVPVVVAPAPAPATVTATV
jgi:hypothetical protein